MKMTTIALLTGYLSVISLAQAQHGPLRETLHQEVQTYAAGSEAVPPTASAPALAKEREPYEHYHLRPDQVHPWPEVEGLPATVHTQRRHIPPFLGVGGDTRSLLSMQADPGRPGKPVPVSGAAAALAWERYLNSFSHPIPEFMEERVSTQSSR